MTSKDSKARRRTSLFVSCTVYEEAQRRAQNAGLSMSQVVDEALSDRWLRDELESDLKAVAAELRANKTETAQCKSDIRDLIHIQAGMVKLIALLLPSLPEGAEIQRMLKEAGNKRYGLFILETALNSQARGKNNVVATMRKIRRERHRGAGPDQLTRLIAELNGGPEHVDRDHNRGGSHQ